MMENAGLRIHYWDNIKGFLIMCVVFGHLLEQLPGGKASVVYKLIYLFHMPLFVFSSGYFATYAPQKILKRLLLPYAFLQVICCMFSSKEIQMTTPFWILWYLPALAFWRITIPFLDISDSKSVPWVIGISLLCGCLSGFDDTVGYYGTLSRIIVFYPYFITGYYAKKYSCFQKVSSVTEIRMRTTKLLLILALIFVTGIFSFLAPMVNARWLYEASSYQTGGYNILFRAGHYLFASVIGCLILALMPKKRTFLSNWGYCSFTIYLVHALVVPVARALFTSFEMNRPLQYIVCAGISIAFCTTTSIGIAFFASGLCPKINK